MPQLPRVLHPKCFLIFFIYSGFRKYLDLFTEFIEKLKTDIFNVHRY